MRFGRQVLMLHPNNRKYLEEAVPAAESPLSMLTPRDLIMGTAVEFREYLPERNTHEEWDSPAGDRFVEYGPEDEAWMKPLGLGDTRVVDDGPAFYLVNEPNWDLYGDLLFKPNSYPAVAFSVC